MTYQAANVYALNQVFLTFMFGFGDKLNFDVHPFAGRVGMDGYDNYPLFSAFLMAFHKYGIFSLYVIYAWRVNMLTTIEEDRYSVKTPLTSKNLYKGTKKVSNWLTDHVACCLVLFFSMTNLGSYLMWWVASRFHPIQQATASTLLIGIMGCIFSSLQVLYEIFQSSRGQSKMLDDARSV